MHVTVAGSITNRVPSPEPGGSWRITITAHRSRALPAIALARKLLRGEVCTRGAMPCMGLLTIDGFSPSARSRSGNRPATVDYCCSGGKRVF